MKKILISLSFLAFTFIFGAISCSREELLIDDSETQAKNAQNEAAVDAILNKIDDKINKEISMLEQYNYNVSAAKSGTEECDPIITVVQPAIAKFPKTVTLDYGKGCTDAEGNFRAGKIVVLITGPIWKTNTVRKAELLDYVFNNLQIKGERKQTTIGQNDRGYYVFEIKDTEKISTTDGQPVIERDWAKERIQNRGADLTSNSDDEVWVTGKAEIMQPGKKIEKEITEPLYRPLTCPFFQSGIISTFIDGVKKNDLNYGVYVPGVCDDKASWTNGVKTKTISLKLGVNYYSLKP